MLERTATTIEPCSLQRVLPSSRKCLQSRRKLHTAFWHHAAADFEFFDACQALMRLPPAQPKTAHPMAAEPAEPAEKLDTMTTASGFLLDFLYPRGTAALLRRVYPMHPVRLEPGPSPVKPMSRLFTSAVPRRSAPNADSQPSAVPPEGEYAAEEDLGELQAGEAAEDVSAAPAREETRHAHPDTLRKLLRSDQPGAYDQIYQLYTNLEPSLKDSFQTDVLLAISRSTRPIEAWRVNELFSSYQVGEWTEDLVRAAVKSQLTLHNVSEAMSIFKTAAEQRGLGNALDYLAAYGLEQSSWDMVLHAWELYSAFIKYDELVPGPGPLQAAGVASELTASQDAQPAAEPAVVQHSSGETASAAEEAPERPAVPAPVLNAPDADEPLVMQDAGTAVVQEIEPPAEGSAPQDADPVASPATEQGLDSALIYGPVTKQNAGPTFPTLAAMANFEARVKELYKHLEQDSDNLPQRTAMVDSFLRHVARSSLTLFRPSDAVFILDRAKDPYSYERYIILNAEQQRKRLAGDLYRKYRRLPGVRVADTVLRAMIDIYFPHDVRGMELLLEDWYRGYDRLDERAYRKFMSFYSGRGDVKSIMRMAQEYAKYYDSKIEQDPKFIANLMHAHAVRGDPDEARRVMEEAAEKTGVPPDLRQWNILLDAHAKAGDYAGAIDLFSQLCEEQEPDEYTFSTIMGIAAWRGDLQFNLELFQLARDRNVQPNVQMMRTLVEAYCQNDRFAEAERLCVRITQKRDIPGDYTYLWNTLLRHHAKRRDLSTVNRLLEAMSSHGIAYNQETYSQLMLALLYCRQSHHAMHLLRVAHREGVFEPTADHFVLLMVAFIHSREPHMALKTNDLMAKMNYPESAFRMTKVIDALGRWQELPVSKRRGVDGEHFLKKILREFYKALEREDQGSPDDIRSVIGLYSKVLFILTQMREHTTVHQIIRLHNSRYPARSTQETIPLKLLHNIMLADFFEKKYDKVKETWNLVLERATERYQPAAAYLNKGGQGGEETKRVVYAQRFRLCDPLKTMQRLYVDEQDADGLLQLVATVRARGFDLDSKNWNYHVQGLARLKKWREAFTVCERVLMPQWMGWYLVRARGSGKNQLPLELRRLGSNPQRPRPIAHTLIILAKEYMDLEQMMLWSHEASREFKYITSKCPKTVHAITTMIRSGSPLEAEIFGDSRVRAGRQGGEGNESHAEGREEWQEEWQGERQEEGQGGAQETEETQEMQEMQEAQEMQEVPRQRRRRQQQPPPPRVRSREKKGERGERIEYESGRTGNVPYDEVWTSGGFLNVDKSVPKGRGQLSDEDVVAALKKDDGKSRGRKK